MFGDEAVDQDAGRTTDGECKAVDSGENRLGADEENLNQITVKLERFAGEPG